KKNGRLVPPVPVLGSSFLKSAAVDHIDLDISETREAQRLRRGWREIDDAAADKGSAIIDPHYDRATAALIRDPHHRAERQRPVRGSERARRYMLAVGGTAIPVNRGNSALRRGRQRQSPDASDKSRSKHSFLEARNSHDHPVGLLMGRVIESAARELGAL